MRPNIDIPWRIHGRMKDHAEHRDIGLSEACVEVMEAGLDASETPDWQ